jgi:hypothetical protein
MVHRALFAVDHHINIVSVNHLSPSSESRHEPLIDDNHPRPTGQDDCRSTGHAA